LKWRKRTPRLYALKLLLDKKVKQWYTFITGNNKPLRKATIMSNYDGIAIEMIKGELAVVVSEVLALDLTNRWRNAVIRGRDYLLEQHTVEYDRETKALLYVSPSGENYTANGTCQCLAFQKGDACKHRAAARILTLTIERAGI
jgi:hypothetical protein